MPDTNLVTYAKTKEFDTINLQNGIINFPNPFSTKTTIGFMLKNNSTVSIYITDMTGRRVATITNNVEYLKGEYTIAYDGSALANGKYICILENSSFRKTCTIVKTN